MTKAKDFSMEKIVAHVKHRGFVFPSSEIYGGLANSWDYGPLGVELKKNLKNFWWKRFIQEVPENVGIDSSILMNSKVWEASGHLSGFHDPMIDCKSCKGRHRVDKLIEAFFVGKDLESDLAIESLSFGEMKDLIESEKITCPDCGQLNYTDIREFNLMFQTKIGVIEDQKNKVYLRPETAQGIFVNFKNIQRSMRRKIPFGIGQIGKSFRNEITPGNFIFRTREFEQMELEFFCEPAAEKQWFSYWKEMVFSFLCDIGIANENIKFRSHDEKELSHYSSATEDVEYRFPFGWGELWGISARTDYDLKQHMHFSGEDFTYHDQLQQKKYIPYCIEPSVGVDRLMLAMLVDAYDEEVLPDGSVRNIMRFAPHMAPVTLAVLPLSKKLGSEAKSIYEQLLNNFTVEYDDAGAIGRRYRRQDEIGTPFCITVDFDSLDDNKVTVRERDSMEQKRVSIDDLEAFIKLKLSNGFPK